MTSRLVLKRTDEFTECEKNQFIDLFSRTFPKDMTPEQFDRKYLRTPFGYSYHGLMLADGAIVGAYNTIPYIYKYFDKSVTFCLSVDTMIDERYRDGGPFSLMKMANLVVNAMRLDGICFTFGFPNDNIYEYTTKLLKWRDIGELDYYLLLRNIGAVVPRLQWLNFVSRACAMTLTRLPSCRNGTEHKYSVEKDRGRLFKEHRYDQSYHVIDMGCGRECVYKIHCEDHGVKVLYVIDVHPLTLAIFHKAISRVYTDSAHVADVILYVGRLPFTSINMIKLPKSRKPRTIRMCGKILDPHVVDDQVFHLHNWNINISNFDVR